MWQVFSHTLACLFIFLIVAFDEQKFLNFNVVEFANLTLYHSAFGSHLQIPYLTQGLQDIL